MKYAHSALTNALVALMAASVSIVAAGTAEAYGNVGGVVQARGAPPVVSPGNKPRAWRSDASIKTDVRRILRNDRSLDDSSITVKSVRRGVVLLTGNAASSGDEARALRSAASRSGVRRVLSEVETLDELTAPFGARNVRVPIEAVSSVRGAHVYTGDDVIRRDVERALYDLDSSENRDIHVVVRDGIVWLSGSVPAWQGNSARIYATRSVTGVRSIINSLRVVAPNDDWR